MKAIYYNVFLTFLALLLLFSCDNEVSLKSEVPQERITYGAEVADIEVVPVTKSGLESAESQLISFCGDYALVLESEAVANEAATKSAPTTTATISEFFTYVYFSTGGVSYITGSKIVKQVDGSWIENDPTKVRYWHPAPTKFNFRAFSKYGASGVVTITPGNPPTLTYDTPAVNSSQVDLLIAEPQLNKDFTSGKISYVFHHALANIGFEVFTHTHEKVASISITGVMDKGSTFLDIPPSWGTLSSASKTIMAGINNSTLNDSGKLGNIMNDNGYLMLIPQDFNSLNPQVTLTLKDGTTIIFPLKSSVAANNIWENGKRYIYRILPRYIENGVDRGLGIPVNIGTEEVPNWKIFAPVNCGYEPYVSTADKGYRYGKLYQWGRKWGHGYNSDDQTYPMNSNSTIVNAPVSVIVATANPNIFYRGNASRVDWCNNSNNFLWNSGTESTFIKSAFDPCPHGWRVPTLDEINGLKSKGSVWTITGTHGTTTGLRGINIVGTPTLFFPAAGALRYDGVAYGNRPNYGFYWVSSPFTTVGRSYAFSFSSSAPTIITSNDKRILGFAVRCVKE